MSCTSKPTASPLKSHPFIPARIINRGGEKISPPEVDEAMMLCSKDIKEAACFSVPDDFFGQEIEAAVVLTNDEMREEDVIALLKERLAEFKVPKRIHFCEGEIPKGSSVLLPFSALCIDVAFLGPGPTGKIQRKNLTKQFAASPVMTNDKGGKADTRNTVRSALAKALHMEETDIKDELTLLELGKTVR